MRNGWRTMAAVALIGGLSVAAGSPSDLARVDLDAEPTAPAVPKSAAAGDQAVKDYLLTGPGRPT